MVAPSLPAGGRIEDYAQTVWAGSVQWGWRHLNVNSELFLNHYETPLAASGLSSRSYDLEAVYTFLPGWYAAGRFDTMRYSEVTTSAGSTTWDENLTRFEMGVGYQVSRELRAKAVAQLTDSGSGWDVHRMLPAVQMSFRF